MKEKDDLSEFLRLVRYMRNAQKEYKRTQAFDAQLERDALEREVDAWLKAWQWRKDQEQGELF